MLPAFHAEKLTNGNVYFFVYGSIIFYDDWVNIAESLKPKVLKWTKQDLIAVNRRIDMFLGA